MNSPFDNTSIFSSVLLQSKTAENYETGCPYTVVQYSALKSVVQPTVQFSPFGTALQLQCSMYSERDHLMQSYTSSTLPQMYREVQYTLLSIYSAVQDIGPTMYIVSSSL